MALVPDSAPVVSLNEDYFSVHFLKEVVHTSFRARAHLLKGEQEQVYS